MKDEQKLKLLRLAIDNANDFDEVKSYVQFILENEALLVSQTTLTCNRYKHTKDIIEDGVYIFSKGYQPIRFEDVWWIENPKKVNVMVSYHGHEWIVAKNDVSEDNSYLLKDNAIRVESSPFYKSEIEALNDFDMKSCTDRLRKLGLCFNLDDDLHIPTLGQLAAMYLYREELNKALKMLGGEPIREEVYWSSSEVDARGSWSVNFKSGYVDYWRSKYGLGYVRPCSAFELKKKGGMK